MDQPESVGAATGTVVCNAVKSAAMTTDCISNDFDVKQRLMDMNGGSPESLVMNIYMDLTEVKDWWNVQAHWCDDLQRALLTGRPGRYEDAQIVLPVNHDEKLSISKMRLYFDIVKQMNIGDVDNGVVLAFSQMDGTVVHYRITDGLVPPEAPDMIAEKRERKRQEFKKRKLRNREYILFRK